MSKDAVATRKRGRPRGFDLDAATATLQRALWSRGFRSTSVEELAADAGLSLSSLYAAFGSKRGVLDAALARYESEMGGMLGELESGTRGLPDIERFVGRVRAVVDDPASPPGCFVVNTMVEVAGGIPEVRERVEAYRRRVVRALQSALDVAAALGDIEAGTSRDRARLIQAALFGALVASRAGRPTAARDGLEAITRELGRWHLREQS
ncbi:hypothetical protein A9W97_17560 [Mycobacterium gordonae]|nr:TetR/AcrR family transcriptional regulator [Mycobacterium gordonae]OBJ87424.1 hypothetical protein A9W97_17560 [Mycobacterium gordonae]